jgi:hypothetical protein
MLQIDLSLAEMAEALDRSPDYLVLRRLVPRIRSSRPAGTDARQFTQQATIAALQKAFPGKRKVVRLRPFVGQRRLPCLGTKRRSPER